MTTYFVTSPRFNIVSLAEEIQRRNFSRCFKDWPEMDLGISLCQFELYHTQMISKQGIWRDMTASFRVVYFLVL